jgi:predicted dehydrogenase
MDQQPIRVAVVGTGAWWGREHARVFSSRPDAELCAVVGRSPERTRARASEFGVNGYLDLGEMLERERPDLVALCLPNEGHFEPTLQVIRAGFPLFVEKPLVFDLDQADILLREAAARSLFFGINFNHRYAATPAGWATCTSRTSARTSPTRSAPAGSASWCWPPGASAATRGPAPTPTPT